MKEIEHYPLSVAYDGQAFVSADRGTGKGLQLSNLLGTHLHEFVGYAPEGAIETDFPMLRQGRSGYLRWQQTSLVQMLYKQRPSVFLAPYNTAPLLVPRQTRLITVVHDLILLENFSSDSMRKHMRDRYRAFLMQRSIARSSLLITVSEFSRQEILKLFPQAHVRVIPCTIGQAWFSEAGRISLAERRNEFLLVTSTPPHKNVERALKAFARYRLAAIQKKEQPATLRIVGLFKAKDAYMPLCSQLQIADALCFEPYVSEEQLRALYRHASAVLVPSLMEGFGIPVLEAMASGTPVISSERTSLPEVAGDAAEYFNPEDVEQMASALGRVLQNASLRADLVRRGDEQKQKFSPQKIYDLAEKFWQELPEMYAGRIAYQ